MATQPRGNRHTGSVRQEVDGTSPVEIDEERAVGLSLADGPVIDSYRSQRTDRRQRHAVHETQHRIGACGHRQMPGQASAGFATEREAHPSLRSGKPIGASCA
ncbi:hypothetical protein ASF26_21715 [Methylobacterium sp. Leaf93]|nr:hypothetical protein ASF26_21715 [Methylobacterium sp. Leaf93]